MDRRSGLPEIANLLTTKTYERKLYVNVIFDVIRPEKLIGHALILTTICSDSACHYQALEKSRMLVWQTYEAL